MPGEVVLSLIGNRITMSKLDIVVPVLASILLTPVSVSVVSGGTQQFSATGYDQFGAVFAISPTWTVGGALATITVTPNPSSVVAGATQQFTAVGYDSNGVVVPIPSGVWTTTNGTITAGGLLTAGAIASGQTVTITSGAITGTSALTVTAAAGPTTVTIFTDPSDNGLASGSTDYLVSRAGNNLVFLNDGGMAVSFINPDYACQEAMLAFDTSVIPDTATITAVVLHGRAIGTNFGSGWTIEARLHDWGAAVETTDWVPGADLASKTLLATRSIAAGWSDAGYNAFTTEAGMIAAINKTGFTRMVLALDTLRGTTAPTGDTGGNIVLDGGTDPAKLVITYTT